MAQYVYPAVFTEEDCGYSINFPDLENCFTSRKPWARESKWLTTFFA